MVTLESHWPGFTLRPKTQASLLPRTKVKSLRRINLCHLKVGEKIDLHLVGARTFGVVKKRFTQEFLGRLHQFRG